MLDLLISGGLIGVVVDAASGATAEYETQVTIVMAPSEFETAAAGLPTGSLEEQNRRCGSFLRERLARARGWDAQGATNTLVWLGAITWAAGMFELAPL